MKYVNSLFNSLLTFFFFFQLLLSADAQAIRIPETKNISCSAGREIGVTDILIKWNAPGVKGREGKIWGTDIAYFGTTILGYGSDVLSPWRAGADECTTISFNTDVAINGKVLKSGTYAFFIELGQDESVLIFNSNTQAWGTYFYDISKDVLRVKTKQQKDQKILKERLEYTFSKETPNSIEVALEWEYWRIPFTVEIDSKATILADIQSQMSGALGFDPPSMIAASKWCLQNDVNLDQALSWVTNATNPNFFGTLVSFDALNVKANILKKKGKNEESDQVMKQALDVANAMELHLYGRQLLGEKKVNEAFAVFEKNYTKNKGVWPTNVGMMRAHSALGNIKKSLDFAKEALKQAPDEASKKSVEAAIKTLESGKTL